MLTAEDEAALGATLAMLMRPVPPAQRPELMKNIADVISKQLKNTSPRWS